MSGANVLCECGNQAKQVQVFKDGPNKGRFFHTCATKSCNFFKWAVTERPSFFEPAPPIPQIFKKPLPPAPHTSPISSPPTLTTLTTRPDPTEGMDALLIKSVAAMMELIQTTSMCLNRLETVLESLETQRPRKKSRSMDDDDEEPQAQ